jgi:hypothetical protein
VLINEFAARTGPSLLIAQINAGGVGLNIQAVPSGGLTGHLSPWSC